MKRFAIVVLSVLLIGAVNPLVAQEAPEPSFDPPASFDFSAPAETPVARPEESGQRERFVEIMRTKADLMDDAELDAAIQQAEAEIQDLQARRMLTDARQTLLRLIEAYPETPSADAARRMLGREPVPKGQTLPVYEDLAPSFTAEQQPLPEPEPLDDAFPVFEEEFSPPPAN